MLPQILGPTVFYGVNLIDVKLRYFNFNNLVPVERNGLFLFFFLSAAFKVKLLLKVGLDQTFCCCCKALPIPLLRHRRIDLIFSDFSPAEGSPRHNRELIGATPARRLPPPALPLSYIILFSRHFGGAVHN